METSAFQVRDLQRQVLNTQLLSLIYHRADRMKHDQHFLLAVLSCLMACLRKAKMHGLIWTECGDSDESTIYYVNDSIVRKIRDFARTDAETYACIACLAKDVLAAATHRFQRDLLSEEIHNPATIFTAKPSMAKVTPKEPPFEHPAIF